MPLRFGLVDSGGNKLSVRTANPIPGGVFALSHAGDTKSFDCDGYGGAAVTYSGGFGTSPNIVFDRLGGDSTWSQLYGVPTDASGTQQGPSARGVNGSTMIVSLLGAARFRVRLFNEPSAPVIVSVSMIPGIVMPYITAAVIGGAPHDAVIFGNPVRIGARAVSASYTTVASGDAADLITTLDGRLITLNGAIPENTWSYAGISGGITNTSAATIKAAAAAGYRNYCANGDVTNPSAVASEFLLRDGAGGTILHRGYVEATAKRTPLVFTPPLRGTAATLMEVVMLTTGTQTYFNFQGWIAP